MRDEDLGDLQGFAAGVAGAKDAPAQLAKMVEALTARVEQMTSSGPFVKHQKANQRLMAELRGVSAILSKLASAPEDEPLSPEQIEKLREVLPQQPTPVFPPSLKMLKKKEGQD